MNLYDNMVESAENNTGSTSVSSLIPLVNRIARKFRRNAWTEPDREDMAQAGFVGLLEAAGRWEADRGCSLSTFGSRRAAGAMMDHVRGLARRSRETPTDEMPQNGEPVYCEDRRSMESGVMLMRFKRFLGGDLDGLDSLNKLESNVVKMRFFDGLTVREAGALLGISPATVVRVERRALAHLREMFLESSCGENVVEQPEDEPRSVGFNEIIASLSM